MSHRTVHVTAAVTHADKEALKAEAARRGISLAQLAGQFIVHGLKHGAVPSVLE